MSLSVQTKSTQMRYGRDVMHGPGHRLLAPNKHAWRQGGLWHWPIPFLPSSRHRRRRSTRCSYKRLGGEAR